MILPTWTGPHAAAYGKERVSCSESELPATSIRDKEGPPKAKPLSELPSGHRPARLQLQALPPACYGQEDTRLIENWNKGGIHEGSVAFQAI